MIAIIVSIGLLVCVGLCVYVILTMDKDLDGYYD
jgi:preprotein translocase subunit SecG